MKQIGNLLLLLFLLGLGWACSSGGKEENHSGRAVELKYATLLELTECENYTLALVKDPWNEGSFLATYVLVEGEGELPKSLPEGKVIRTPLQKAVVTSSVHASLLLELGAGEKIAGLTDVGYIISPEVKSLLEDHGGGARDMGSTLLPDAELAFSIGADAILVSPFENAGHGAWEREEFTLIECADYMEVSPLARAEWMRFYGRLFGEGEKADSLFERISQSYVRLKSRVREAEPEKPKVICDLLLNGVWYTPGGASTMGQLLVDAGADYPWADRARRGSLSLNLESIFAEGRDADFWLVKYGQTNDLTYAQMAVDCPQYTDFEAWKNRHVLGCNTLKKPFYEETPFHPEKLLAELIAIFHPRLQAPPSQTFYSPLAEE